jgi:hypothetical protein
LTPLRGMAIKKLYLYNTNVTDLSPLEGMPIETLNLSGTKVRDISVLRGMPLLDLRLHKCEELMDLSPIADATMLKEITLPVQARNFEFLRVFKWLKRMSFTEDLKSYVPDKTAEEFWQEYDAKSK